MRRHDADRIIKAKCRDYTRRIMARLKRLPGNVRLYFAGDSQRGESSPGSREQGAFKDLEERVQYSAVHAGLNGDEKEEPKGDEFEESFRFDEDDLVFVSEVARRLALLTDQPSLAPEEVQAIGRAVAALKKLPEPTPGIDVQIEVAHRMGGEGFSESYSYAIRLDERRIEISSSGSQYDPAVGSDSFGLESLKWYANGQAAHQGNRDTWLERLSYALARDHALNVTDKSAGQCTETV